MRCVFQVWKVSSLRHQLTTLHKKRRLGEELYTEDVELEERIYRMATPTWRSCAPFSWPMQGRGYVCATTGSWASAKLLRAIKGKIALMGAWEGSDVPSPGDMLVNKPPDSDAAPLLADLMSGPNAPLSKPFLFSGWRSLPVDILLDPSSGERGLPAFSVCTP